MKHITKFLTLFGAIVCAAVFLANTASAARRAPMVIDCRYKTTPEEMPQCWGDSSSIDIDFNDPHWKNGRQRREDAAAAAAVAANNCGTGQVRVGGLCQELAAAVKNLPPCPDGQVQSGQSCVPIPNQSSGEQCEPASWTNTYGLTVENPRWGTPTAGEPTCPGGYNRSGNCIGGEVPTTHYPAVVSGVLSFGSCKGSPIITGEYSGYTSGYPYYFAGSIAYHCPSGTVPKHVYSGVRGNTDNVLTFCVAQ